MCPANCQSRGLLLLARPVICPNEVDPAAHVGLGFPNTTLLVVFRQSASNTKFRFSWIGIVRRNPASISQLYGFRSAYAWLRGALPIRYCAVLVVDTFCGCANAFTSTYLI